MEFVFDVSLIATLQIIFADALLVAAGLCSFA